MDAYKILGLRDAKLRNSLITDELVERNFLLKKENYLKMTEHQIQSNNDEKDIKTDALKNSDEFKALMDGTYLTLLQKAYETIATEEARAQYEEQWQELQEKQRKEQEEREAKQKAKREQISSTSSNIDVEDLYEEAYEESVNKLPTIDDLQKEENELFDLKEHQDIFERLKREAEKLTEHQLNAEEKANQTKQVLQSFQQKMQAERDAMLQQNNDTINKANEEDIDR